MARLFFILSCLFPYACSAQNTRHLDSFRYQIREIATSKDAKVGVSIIAPDGKDVISINGIDRFPMQSVFKFHIAVVVLTLVDQGEYRLDQEITIGKSDLTPDIWSPIREEYPDGTVLTLAEIISYTVSQSDNVGCDILLGLVGGPAAVESYFKGLGVADIAIVINEEVMQGNWELQFLNWTTPTAATQALSAVYHNEGGILSAGSHDFIWKVMRETSMGQNRIKGLLPPGTVVAHKTGYSGRGIDGVIAASNDIGVVFLANGDCFFISVFVTEAKEDLEATERIIAEVAKVAWDYFAVSASGDGVRPAEYKNAK